MEALAQLETESVDIVLLDIRMPGVDGIGVAEQLASKPTATGVNFLYRIPRVQFESV